jgi:hypothetical protein
LPEQIIDRVAEKWNDCAGLEETTLIRLAILRDLMTELHAEKSRCLALGMKAEAQSFRKWEGQIEDLRIAAPLEGPIQELLANSKKLRHRTRLLPDSLFSFVAKEKLDRYDRVWESTIAAEASSLGWCFWVLDAWVDMSTVAPFQSGLSDALIPHGVVLFAESAPEPIRKPGQTDLPSDTAGNPNLWHGNWFVVLKPRYRTPGFNVEKLPGISQEPVPAQWKLLFSPKKR